MQARGRLWLAERLWAILGELQVKGGGLGLGPLGFRNLGTVAGSWQEPSG